MVGWRGGRGIGPVLEAAGFDDGDEAGAEGGFGEGGELEGGDAALAQGGGEPVDEAFAGSGGVGDDVADLPVAQPGERAVDEGGRRSA